MWRQTPDLISTLSKAPVDAGAFFIRHALRTGDGFNEPGEREKYRGESENLGKMTKRSLHAMRRYAKSEVL